MKNKNNTFFESSPQPAGQPTGKGKKEIPTAARGQKGLPSRSRWATQKNPFHIGLWRVMKPLVAVGIGLAVVGAGLVFGYHYVYDHLFSPVDAKSTEQVQVVIKSGSSLSSISQQLEDQGIIRNHTAFKYYVDFSDMSSKLLAGTFTLSPSMTFDDIIDVLKRPTEVYATTTLTFKEGDTIEDYAQMLVKEGLLKNDTTFLSMCRSGVGQESHFFVKQAKTDRETTGVGTPYLLEGYLAPDTYEFYTTANEKDVISKLTGQFNKVFTEEYITRAAELNMTTSQVVTLASILEKEAKTGDFAKVSAVFHNRLKEGMNLQSDATVQYLKEDSKLILTEEDLKEDTPYNTHLYKGLPPGPICNPGQKAIHAALYPDETALKEGYLYFCLGDPLTGEIVYAKTYEEHQKNVNKYKELWELFDKGIRTKPEHASIGLPSEE